MTMNIELVHEIVSQPWAIEPSALQALYIAVRSGTQDERVIESAMMKRGMKPQMNGTVAVIPVRGVIRQRRSSMEAMFGMSFGTTTEDLMQACQQAMADEAVKAVIFDIDSPGGTTAGVAELADAMFKMRGQKPMVAVANAMCASAAYHLASQCDEIVGTPTSLTGSIGVVAVHEDMSRMMDEMGVTVTMIAAGKYKTEGNSFEPLTDEAKGAIQRLVDEHYGLFVGAVARGRGVSAGEVRSGFGQGRVLSAKDAKAAGLIDRIGTLRETVQRMGGTMPDDMMDKKDMMMHGWAAETELKAQKFHVTAPPEEVPPGEDDAPEIETEAPVIDGDTAVEVEPEAETPEGAPLNERARRRFQLAQRS